MGYEIDDKGNIKLRQGDSMELVIDGIPTDQNYKVFFAAQNEERVPIGNELEFDSLGQSFVVIKLLGNYTNQFTVDEDKKTQKYYYGVKICSEVDETEQTLALGDSSMDNLNTITVYPRKVEGI
jgi:hypothetical protein